LTELGRDAAHGRDGEEELRGSNAGLVKEITSSAENSDDGALTSK